MDEEKFKKVFFEAWELENDDNLSLSLLDSIIQTTPDGDKVGLRDAILAIGKGISKSLTVGIGPLKFNMKEVLQAVEEANQKLDEVTFIKKIAEFKDKYKSLEAEILGDNNHKKLIVFVDDLDRCEPANVLNLLSVIKLFFTYGKRTVFVCGIDKEVVNKAVYHKYDNVVKSEEYLEKVFDISFDMPKSNISKMIEYYFKDDQDKKRIEEFLYVMEFTNPRHIKKLLNKYVLIKYYQAKGIDKRNLIPDQKIFFFKILTLFIIIIYEFDYKSFEFIRNYDEKLSYYAEQVAVIHKKRPLLSRFMTSEIANPTDIGGKTIERHISQSYQYIQEQIAEVLKHKLS